MASWAKGPKTAIEYGCVNQTLSTSLGYAGYTQQVWNSYEIQSHPERAIPSPRAKQCVCVCVCGVFVCVWCVCVERERERIY